MNSYITLAGALSNDPSHITLSGALFGLIGLVIIGLAAWLWMIRQSEFRVGTTVMLTSGVKDLPVPMGCTGKITHCYTNGKDVEVQFPGYPFPVRVHINQLKNIGKQREYC